MRRPIPYVSSLRRVLARFARRLWRAILLRRWPPPPPCARNLRAALFFMALGLEGCALGPVRTEPFEAVSQGIMGGAETPACEWPAVVALGGCSGTLVHASLVVYAAHCGLAMAQVRFGTDSAAPARVAEVSHCRAFPGAQLGDGSDVAYCVLREAVLDIQPARILAGCELDALSVGTAAHIVGFGVDATGGEYGTQRTATTFVADVSAGEFFLDSSASDTCRGDSGGPVFIEVAAADGRAELRLAGVTSAGSSSECGQGVGYYINLAAKLAWLESSSGLDVTPCFEGDVWTPTPACLAVPGGRPMVEDAPEASDGRGLPEEAACQPPAEAELSSTCGEAFASLPDAEPPSIELTGIADDSLVHHLAVGQQYLALEVALRVEDDGWGVEHVGITLLGADGTPLFEREDQVAPYGIEELRIPPGTFELLVEARDHAGNSSARAVQLQVVAPVSEDAGCAVGRYPVTPGNTGWMVFALSLVLSVRRAAGTSRSRSGLEARQHDVEAGAASHLRFDLDLPTGLANDRVERSKAQAGAAVVRFGREEGLEDVFQYLGGHAATFVDDADHDLRPVIGVGQMPAASRERRRVDPDGATVCYGVPCIDDEVHQHLSQLTRRDHDSTDGRLGHHLERHLSRNHGRKQLDAARQKFVDVDVLRLGLLGAGDIEQLPH